MKTSRKLIIAAVVAAIACCMALCFAGCSGSSTSSSSNSNANATTTQKQDIVVGILQRDEADIQYVADKLKDKYNITTQVFSDNNAINEAVNGGELLVNYWQNDENMIDWNTKNNGKLVSYNDAIFFCPTLLVSRKFKSVNDITSGATFVISDSKGTQARTLRMLAKNGLITLNDSTSPTIYDVVDNPHNFQWIETSSRNGWAAFADADLLTCTGTTILSANDPTVTCSGALLVEDSDTARSIAGVKLVVTQDTAAANPQWLQDMYEVMTSKDFQEFLTSNYQGAKQY